MSFKKYAFWIGKDENLRPDGEPYYQTFVSVSESETVKDIRIGGESKIKGSQSLYEVESEGMKLTVEKIDGLTRFSIGPKRFSTWPKKIKNVTECYVSEYENNL